MSETAYRALRHEAERLRRLARDSADKAKKCERDASIYRANEESYKRQERDIHETIQALGTVEKASRVYGLLR